MMRSLGTAALLALLAAPAAWGQTAPTPAATREPPAVGVAASNGLFGWVAAVRASAPIDDHWAFDATVGHISGQGRTASGPQGVSASAQVRWLRGGRRPSGASGHWIFGVMMQHAIDRTEIRFPNRTIVTRSDFVNVTPQIGYGWDRAHRSGARYGLELSTGGNTNGPSQYIQVFVVWGRPIRS